jgi:DNA invertase Pin-like site-specific DNA recombinase
MACAGGWLAFGEVKKVTKDFPLCYQRDGFFCRKRYTGTMKTTAFSYLRVSGRGQVDGDGFPRQRAAVTAYAKAHGITIKQEFCEKAISGAKDLEDRPELSALMVALHANGTRLVLIEKLDRLARDLMVQESIIADLRRGGFEIISVAEPDLCSDDPSRKLMRQMMGAFAEYEKSMIVAKLRGARQRTKAKTGRCEGRKPYGELAGEREVIERMFQLYDEGAGYTAVHRYLNMEGVKSRDGGAWTAATVMRIMKREPERLHRMTPAEAIRFDGPVTPISKMLEGVKEGK